MGSMGRGATKFSTKVWDGDKRDGDKRGSDKG